MTPSLIIEREAPLQKIFSRISAERPQSYSIIGDRKIGKTQLLLQVLDPDIQRRYIADPGRFCFYYKDVKDEVSYHEKLIADILRTFSRCSAIEPVQGETVYSKLYHFLAEEHNRNRVYVIVIDNFHYFKQDSTVPLDFFSYLRSLANRFPLAYVITSVYSSYWKDLEESPFINIFTNMELQVFNREEAEAMQNLSGQELPAKAIHSLTGNHPYLMDQVIKLMLDPEFSGNLDKIRNQVIKENMTFIEELIQSNPDYHRDVFIRLATGMIPGNREKYKVTPLVKRGYLNSDFNYTSDIMREILLLMGQSEKRSFFSKLFRK